MQTLQIEATAHQNIKNTSGGPEHYWEPSEEAPATLRLPPLICSRSKAFHSIAIRQTHSM
jgi:hypothetical protein